MNKKRDFLFKILWVVFKMILMVNIFFVYFLDVIKFFFSKRQYFGAVVKEDSV